MDKGLRGAWRKEHAVSESSALLVMPVTSQCVAYSHHLDKFPVTINTANDPALVAKTPNIGQGTKHLTCLDLFCVGFFKKF